MNSGATPTDGQVLVWNSSTSKFEAGDQTGSGGGSNVSLTSFSVTTAAPSGNGSLAYDNAGVFTFTPANVSGGGGGWRATHHANATSLIWSHERTATICRSRDTYRRY
mgnify:CR=1 FL=1